jgi:hypothetical protein
MFPGQKVVTRTPLLRTSSRKVRESARRANFEHHDDIRAKVLSLVSAVDTLRKLGKNLISQGLKVSARDRLLTYFQMYPLTVLNEKELAVVAGISEWARRVRELRTEDGFPISTKMSGNPNLGVGEYVLEQDRQTPKHDRSIPEPARREVLRRDQYVRDVVGVIPNGIAPTESFSRFTM